MKISTSLKSGSARDYEGDIQGRLTFKISSKRSDHTFELDSRELNQTLGGAVFEAIPTIQAQMKKPDINLQVEIREEAAYISYETIKGSWWPSCWYIWQRDAHAIWWDRLSSSWLLSLEAWGGYRGRSLCEPPYTSPGALKKAHDLTRKLTKFGGNIQFIEVPFTEIQEEIKGKSARSLPHDPDPSLYDAHHRSNSRGSRWFGHYQW